MQKINFINGQSPALNANNLNLIQTNVENAIDDAIDEATGTASSDATSKVNSMASTLRGEISTAQSNAVGTANTYTDNKVKNATLTIQKNGSNVATFGANASSNVTANITVPTVNNGTLTIQKNGSTVATFGANTSDNKTANITVPTNNNQLTNGAGYITATEAKNYADTVAQNARNGAYSDTQWYVSSYKIQYGTSLPSSADNGVVFLLY